MVDTRLKGSWIEYYSLNLGAVTSPTDQDSTTIRSRRNDGYGLDCATAAIGETRKKLSGSFMVGDRCLKILTIKKAYGMVDTISYNALGNRISLYLSQYCMHAIFPRQIQKPSDFLVVKAIFGQGTLRAWRGALCR